MIDQRALQGLRERLERRLAELESLLSDTADVRRPLELDQTSVGRLSRMDAMQQQATRAGLREAFDRERRRVQAALQRMGDTRYGLCCACEDELSVERLHADPAAPFCMDCEMEIMEKKRNRPA
jgi:DnaK suppressor protein